MTKSAQAMVRIGATMGLLEVLRGLGANPRATLSDAGFDIELFDDPDNLISYTARGRLLARCAAQTNCAHLGLLVGQRSGLASLGLVGFLVRYSPDVGTALRDLARHLHLHVRGAETALAVDGSAARLSYRIYQRGAQANDQVGDGALAVLCNIMCELCGPGWEPIEVEFAHRKPQNVEPFRRFFGAPLHFDAEHNAVVFSASWLKRPLPGVDSDVRRLVQKQVEALGEQHGDSFPDQVRTVLRAALATGNGSKARIAALFSMHQRTFARRLHSCGIGYRALVDEICLEMARQLLSDTELRVSEIAQALHYADARSFIRAFGRWSGATPAGWRATRKMARRSSEQSGGE